VGAGSSGRAPAAPVDGPGLAAAWVADPASTAAGSGRVIGDRVDTPPRALIAAVRRALHLSEATVKAHVSRVLTKLGLTNRVQAAILVHDADL
jgi:hypothetical protein